MDPSDAPLGPVLSLDFASPQDRAAAGQDSPSAAPKGQADGMLDPGFLETFERILARTPSSRRTALSSARMPPAIRRLAAQYLYDPVTVQVQTATLTVDTVEQFVLEVTPREKPDRLADVLQAERPDQAIIFVRTKIRCEQLYKTLRDRGMNVKALHGDMTQGARDGVMISFKDGRLPLLVATDVASRGLDIPDVSHVINYDIPLDPESYVHRIGRTGRAGVAAQAHPAPGSGGPKRRVLRHAVRPSGPHRKSVVRAPGRRSGLARRGACLGVRCDQEAMSGMPRARASGRGPASFAGAGTAAHAGQCRHYVPSLTLTRSVRARNRRGA